ncbi:hypothetical protein IEQ34_017499 [Dendrobium chrysotoxum]|uniref:Uncharacterized protein n=1 Tax=Dendrobium chrysotoxum TaxID=161865 RepID=A0AAV7GAJ3_DENCH|nr:hypothetical protein IEQ34_017499 [Dendrobium chrysotoxum]
MHGHDLSECFKLHPHLQKDKESTRQSKVKEGILNDNVNVELDHNIGDANGEIAQGNDVDNLQPGLIQTDRSSFNGGEFLNDQSKDPKLDTILYSNQSGGEKQMLTTNSNNITVPPSLSNPCVSKKTLSDMVINDVNTNYSNQLQSHIMDE